MIRHKNFVVGMAGVFTSLTEHNRNFIKKIWQFNFFNSQKRKLVLSPESTVLITEITCQGEI